MSQNNIEIVSRLQEYIDEHKEEISSEIYKNISELNMRQFNIHQNNFYKVTYITHIARKFDQDDVNIKPEKRTSIVKIPYDTYLQLEHHISLGNTCIDCMLCFEIVRSQLISQENYITFEGTESCEDTDCIYHTEYFRQIKIQPSLIILGIEKA